MSKFIFSGKIKCSLCGKNYRGKSERNNKRVYLCGGYNNKNGCTKRIVISEEFLINAINKRYQLKTGNELSHDEIREKVDKIEIEDKLLLTIHLIDDEPIIYGRNQIIY